MSVAGKRIVIGITGGIAAYKVPELVRRLKERGAEVRVIMTASAQEFITPLTLQAVSGEPVSDTLLDPAAEAGMGHIELAKWADLLLIAPASANTLARVAAGLADDLLTTVALATPAPLAVAPAMNQQMYRHPATQANLATLQARSACIWGPAKGEQACGDVGPGRMLEPMALVAKIEQYFAPAVQPLAGLKLMLTAGPTREALDPVRYISNHSSGKMGFALAAAARALGADVTLVSGPVSLATPAGVQRINVESAQNMYDAVMAGIDVQHIFIACAAVADYAPKIVASHKIKKTSADNMVVELTKNPDIVAAVAALQQKPFTVGFAAETRDVEKYALDKLKRKNLDMIAANDVSGSDRGFNSDQNALSVFWQGGLQHLPLADKTGLAEQLLTLIAKRYHDTH
ncbi:bifunctional phosphopantothenoylcysteine decarboxylase/phosphopantothenate--cysteine ligase CoaBC [Oceanimonas baumannii]|uniref:Coenzyme A biosynthesis bifunctional protein CoaBC n=1 Tax=Oceanimonas baumannii TaxID=129578 RepID=A0A235CIB3_9GAMM|nr:bifunctional phosphopantothenoylcysteine decarboxylase/phosphopantothenate--cysteine ligase CoaBC [Oceanimonas baumannii]OYD24351.1 bifunctional phosphopantothenoylcysteine decarboxylase/phosphopantothenate--cysteine ligase CoaBC [Oceanimonas baumannii]TDW59089.1 phosphopantothenoylcysteine decarboxylase/phosphopantothenate--cysteine ligase [Oceanimonas baumannii]